MLVLKYKIYWKINFISFADAFVLGMGSNDRSK